MMMKKFSKERGVALLFALGLLTLLLVLGMAFVANALTARKIAANNSSRSQARMFALSALNRVAASIMIYQYQIYKSAAGQFPESFDGIYSKGEVETKHDSTDKQELADGLKNQRDSVALMRLPMDDSIVAKNLATQFNGLFNASWRGSWVYFYNYQSGDDRRIIGRAAWQVLSTSPQILAPVFYSGSLETDGSPGWTPRAHRWGREIDEVDLRNTAVFSKVADGSIKNLQTAGKTIKDFDLFYSMFDSANPATDQEKRFLERWLMPDQEGSDILDPTPVLPEVYAYKDGNKKIQLLRFNISEIFKDDITKYGVPAANDPWYARFGIDSSNADNINNDAVVNRLALDSPEYERGDKFDHEISKDDRPSLPFLRRIGNKDADKPTFGDDVTSWRKQIAANLNDYMDADSVPTSDIPSSKWLDALNESADNQPKYTGNEKTPYLYEIGFQLGIHPGADKVTEGGIELDTVSGGTDNKYSVPVKSIALRMASMVKLANLYNFATTVDYTAAVDPGEVTVTFKPSNVSLTVGYKSGDNTGSIPIEVSDTSSLGFNEVTATVGAGVNGFQDLSVTFNPADLKNDTAAGAKPYPFKYGKKDNFKAIAAVVDNPLGFTLSRDSFNALSAEDLPDGATIESVSLKINAVKVSKVTVKPRRMVLGHGTGSSFCGVDYVRKFDNPLKWEDTANPVEIDFADSTNKLRGLVLGGIMNYDPRQNLNPADWYPTADTEMFKVAAATNYEADDIANLAPSNVMCVMSSTGDGDKNSHDDAAIANRFNPAFDSELQDVEAVAEPGLKLDSNQFLSTAFIRNAPMMSPWELGLIHRGVRWQTLNIKTACAPCTSNPGCEPTVDNAVKLTDHGPHGGDWTKSGTCYKGGDGAILDQIKMTDQCSTYGKINVNKLRVNSPDFNNLDKDLVIALLDNIHHGQTMGEFITESTRDASQNFPAAASTQPVLAVSADTVTKFTAIRDQNDSRAQFLNFVSSSESLETAFGLVTSAVTDAAQEEIVGKTINLLCAEPTTPSQIQAVVVAQSIRDVAGQLYREVAEGVASDISTDNGVTKDGNMISKECSYGKFDFAEHEHDAGKNIYFDEITGEVKMFVTIDRDINTGRLVIRRIDYLE